MSLATIPPRSANTHRDSLLGSLSRTDWLLLLTLFVALFTLCAVRSHHRLFWADELYGYQVLGSPTFTGMLRGWREGADGGGIFYYLLGRLWVDLFGIDEFTLRAFSTAGMCAALLLCWAALRRYFSLPSTASAVAVIFLTARILIWQETNGRFYGLFLASAAFASLCFLLGNDLPSNPPSRKLLLLTAAAHAMLIGSHILGLVYSFALIAATVALGILHRRLRARLLLAELAGWCILPPSLHAIRASSAIATNVFWTQRPSPQLLLPALGVFSRPTQWLLLGAAFLALAVTVVRRLRSPAEHPGRKAAPFLPPAPAALVAAMILAELILFLKSQHGISVFADRYLLPLGIASAFLFAACVERFLPFACISPERPWPGRLLATAAVLACLTYPASRVINSELYPPPRYVTDNADAIPPGATVVLANPGFNLLSHYDPTHDYIFMTNWTFDSQPQHANGDLSGVRLMENWRRAGYLPGHILTCSELFNLHPNFFLSLDFQRAAWFHERLEHNPEFQLRPVTHIPGWWPSDIWAVHRVAPGDPPAPPC